MNAYTANFAPYQSALRDEAAQLAPPTGTYGQHLGAMLSRAQAPGGNGMQDLSSFMSMMQQFKGLQQPGQTTQQPLAPVYDHSFPSTSGDK